MNGVCGRASRYTEAFITLRGVPTGCRDAPQYKAEGSDDRPFWQCCHAPLGYVVTARIGIEFISAIGIVEIHPFTLILNNSVR